MMAILSRGWGRGGSGGVVMGGVDMIWQTLRERPRNHHEEARYIV